MWIWTYTNTSQARRCVQVARILTALRLQRHKLARKRASLFSYHDAASYTIPWEHPGLAPTRYFFTIHSVATLPDDIRTRHGPARGMGRCNGKHTPQLTLWHVLQLTLQHVLQHTLQHTLQHALQHTLQHAWCMRATVWRKGWEGAMIDTH